MIGCKWGEAVINSGWWVGMEGEWAEAWHRWLADKFTLIPAAVWKSKVPVSLHMAALLFLHHNILNETVRGKYRPSKVCALSEEMYNLASSVWRRGSAHQPYSKCKTAPTRTNLNKSWRNQEILANRLLRQKFGDRHLWIELVLFFELSSLVFTSKDMKGVAKSRTVSPQFLSLESPLSAAVVSFQGTTRTIDSH